MMIVVTSSCSRAWVQSAWIVYMAEPSASSEMTGRPGRADRGAGRGGQAPADRAAGQVQVVVLAGARRAVLEERGGGDGLVDHDRVVGQQRADDRGERVEVERAAGRELRARGSGSTGRAARAPTRSASASSAASESSSGVASTVTSCRGDHSRLGLPGIGEEPDRRRASRRRSGARSPAARRPPSRSGRAAAARRGREPPRSSRGVNVSWKTAAPVPAAIRAAARRPGRRAWSARRAGARPRAGAQRPRGGLDRLAGHRRRAAPWRAGAAAPRLGSQPASAGRISVATPPRARRPRPPRRPGSPPSGRRARVPSQCEAGRAMASMSLVSGAPSGLCTTACSPTRLTIGVRRLVRVVDVRERVAEAGAEVQQRRGGDAGHARVAVGGRGRHALEQGQHAAHLGHAVHRRHEVHLRGARVGEADAHAGRRQRAQHALGAVHAAHHASAR